MFLKLSIMYFRYVFSDFDCAVLSYKFMHCYNVKETFSLLFLLCFGVISALRMCLQFKKGFKDLCLQFYITVRVQNVFNICIFINMEHRSYVEIKFVKTEDHCLESSQQ